MGGVGEREPMFLGGVCKRTPFCSTQGLPKVYPRVSQAQRCCLCMGRAWVRLWNTMGSVKREVCNASLNEK